MTVLVDTGVLFAYHDTDAPRHDEAVSALNPVYDGELGQPFVSDYIYDEAVTLTLKRTDSFDAAASMGERIRGVGQFPTIYELVHVTTAVFDETVSIFERYDDQGLSFTDTSSIALVERRGLDSVLSFDDDFDGLVDRIDPESL